MRHTMDEPSTLALARQHRAGFAAVLTWILSFPAWAADVVVQPVAGSAFVVKDASGANERLRVQESGAISMPGVLAAPAQSQGLCVSASGQLGPCSSSTGGSYTAATGLILTGTTFAVAPTYQLPQSCTANQVPQWSGTAWGCVGIGSVNLPSGTLNQTLRYDASNTLVANNLLKAFGDGGLVADGTLGAGNIPATGAGTRLMWVPAEAAFRAGYVDGAQWDDARIGNFSMAVGANTVASGTYSTAMGKDTTANGVASTAVGQGTTASGQSSTAMGLQAWASGDGATAIGISTTASAGGATAMGQISVASGPASTAMGSSVASGLAATAMGKGTTASGANSTAIGHSSVAGGISSVAMGDTANAAADFSIAMGSNATADGKYSMAVGRNVSTGGYIGSFIYGDASSARGTSSNSAHNQFMVLASGGVTLATSPAGLAGTGAVLAPGSSSWAVLSDRNAKTAIQSVDTREVFRRVVAMPMKTWQYKTQDSKYRHMGPMAQDFYAAFQLGESDKGIDTVDADGVALAAIQGLNALLAEKEAKTTARLEEKDRELATLRSDKDREIAELRSELAAQKTQMAALQLLTGNLAGDLADMKAQLATSQKPLAAANAVALRQP